MPQAGWPRRAASACAPAALIRQTLPYYDSIGLFSPVRKRGTKGERLYPCAMMTNGWVRQAALIRQTLPSPI